MNAIFRYLKSKLHVLLFILLEIFCIIIIVRNNVYQSAYYFSNTRQIAGKVQEVNHSIFDYFNLYHKNQALSNENLRLRKQLKDNYIIESRKVFVVNDTVYKQRYEYIPAEVITNTINLQNNYITINRGTTSGIEKGLWIFCPEGVVGRIVEVSENYSVAQSLLNSNMMIAPKIEEMNLSRGTLQWAGKDPNFIELQRINKYEQIKVGYHIVTSPYLRNLPENIPIGTVQKIETKPSESFYYIKVKLAVDFGKISTVYVVKDLFKKELEELENKLNNK
ncbi:MAG: rod shape-determining protein MreC [Bacteroidota bacterium]